jgi:ribosomal protein S18 acetylase RimI-like enzyme
MYKIIEIDQTNIDYLKTFLINDLPNTFRYFNKRSIDILNNHILTILLLDNEIPIGYAHIDLDDNKYWFGICLLTEYQNKGFGKQIMEYVFNNKKIKNINIYLTVDKININAIHLYKKFNFNIIVEMNTYYLMELGNIS